MLQDIPDGGGGEKIISKFGLVQIGLIALLTGIICYPLAQLNLPKLATLTLVSLVYGGLYLGFLLTFRILKVEDKALLKRWLTLQALRPQEKSDE